MRVGFMMIYCTDKCPKYALCKPNTPLEAPPPAPTLGAGDLIDGGRRLDPGCEDTLTDPILAREYLDEDEFVLTDPDCIEDALADPMIAGDYLDEDELHMVLALSSQIKTHDLSPRAVSTILARPRGRRER